MMTQPDPDITIMPPTVKQAGDPRGQDATWTLLPPSPEVCSQCAKDHEPDVPHDQRSLYYQFAFRAETGRWPTWNDAMAHCTEETQIRWRIALRHYGVEIGDA